MNDQLTLILVGIFILLTFQSLSAQEKLIPLDTIELQGKRVVIYQQNVWQELQDEDPILADARAADTLEIFARSWEQSSIYAYSQNGLGHAIPEAIVLALTDDDRDFVLPHYGRILSGFGWRGSRTHDGLDIGLNKGEPILAAFDGKVRYARYHNNGYGNLVIIRHFNGLETYYAHLSAIYVEPDQMVKAGQIIGAGGSTGSTYHGAHLHFETRWFDNPFDPLAIIDYENESLFSDTAVLTPEDFKASKPAKDARNLQPLSQRNPYLEMEQEYPPAEISMQDPDTLQVTKASSAQTLAENQVYIVRKGDSLYKIAKNYHTTVSKLCELNQLTTRSVLKPGQKIKVN